MASAAPQKRMVSSVFITLASPHRATITPSTRSTITHTARRTSSTDSEPKALPHGVHSDTRHTHSGPLKDTPAGPRTPTASSSIATSPAQTHLAPANRVAPPPDASGLHGAVSQTQKTATRNRSIEDDLPPPPPPPPLSPPSSAQTAQLCSDLTSPLPPPPVLEPSVKPTRSIRPEDRPQPASQCSQMRSATVPVESTPPSGGNQEKLLRPVQPRQEEYADLESKDVCGFCRKKVALTDPAIEALNRTYHASCFQCRQCQTALAGQMYYNKAGIPLCEDCYLASLEQCWACGEVIKDHVIRALGRAYHPPCFVCATCSRPIGEEKFAQGEVGEVYCLPDYYRKYAPQCKVCQQLIVPLEDGRDSFTVECLGHSFHEDCYRCEVCSILLSTEPNDQGCFPLDGQILCKPCHLTIVQERHH